MTTPVMIALAVAWIVFGIVAAVQQREYFGQRGWPWTAADRHLTVILVMFGPIFLIAFWIARAMSVEP